jgi:hypothetical protein
MSIHLARNVCDGCAVWCHFDRDKIGDAREVDKDRVDHYEEGYTSDPAEADCYACLKTAEAYGAAVKSRLWALEPKERAPVDVEAP